jgi:CubicO group peptidase (beta-lactamase class C family)
MTPRDMARIGQILLRRGRVDGRQIVSSGWLDSLAVRRNAQNMSWSALGGVNYGYLWWLPQEIGNGTVLAAGYGGQFVLVDPSRDLIIVTTAVPPIDGLAASEQENFILTTIVERVLPAVVAR